MIIPCKDDAFYIFRSDRDFSASTHLCINTSRAFPDSLRTCFCLGDVSSTLVAFLMFSVNSFSAFSRSTGRVGRWSSKRGLKERRILALVKKRKGSMWTTLPNQHSSHTSFAPTAPPVFPLLLKSSKRKRKG